MAVLTAVDKTKMKRDYFRLGQGKLHFKGGNPSLNGIELMAVMQAIEDKWEAGKAGLKTAMDTAAGKTLTNAQVKVLGRAWLKFKAEGGN